MQQPSFIQAFSFNHHLFLQWGILKPPGYTRKLGTRCQFCICSWLTSRFSVFETSPLLNKIQKILVCFRDLRLQRKHWLFQFSKYAGSKSISQVHSFPSSVISFLWKENIFSLLLHKSGYGWGVLLPWSHSLTEE